MPDDARPNERELRAAEALARLPLETPERSAWPALAARIAATEHRPHGPRWPLALAAAAAAVLALALVLPLGGEAPPARPPAPELATPSPETALPALMAESAQLEAMLARLGDESDGSANAVLLGLELEDQLRDIDAALGDPRLPADQSLALWQQRVDLLRDYAGLRGTAQWLAVQGDELEGALVATF